MWQTFLEKIIFRALDAIDAGLTDLMSLPWDALERRRPFVINGWIATLLAALFLAYHDWWLVAFALIVGSSVAVVMIARQQAPIAQARPEIAEPMPWRTVIMKGARLGFLLAVIWQAVSSDPAMSGFGGRLAFAMAGTVACFIEWEHWRRNGYRRFHHLWPQSIQSSLGAVLLTLFLSILGALPLIYLLLLFTIPPDTAAVITERLRQDLHRDNLSPLVGLVIVGLLTETPVFLGMIAGAAIGWRRRIWLSGRRIAYGYDRTAECGEAIAATLQWLTRIGAFLKSIIIIGFVCLIAFIVMVSLPIMELEILTAAKDAHIEGGEVLFRIFLFLLTLVGLSLVGYALQTLLIVFNPKPPITDLSLGAARLGTPPDLRRTGINAP